MTHARIQPGDQPSPAELIAARPALSAHAMDGLLLDGIPLAAIAAAHGTPCWVTGATTLRARYRRLAHAMAGVCIHYAVKANDHLAILALLAAEGAGADVVSGGELLRARQAGIPAHRIVFSGVGKTASELALALRHGVGQINVESEEELHELSTIATALGTTARIALRVNPDVDAGTLDAISTGRAGDKFGIPAADIPALYAAAARLPGLHPTGLAVHIGSQIFGMSAFAAAYRRIATLVTDLRAAGHPVDAVDCGGGLGIPYAEETACLPEAWAACIAGIFGHLDLRLAIEPGRWLVGPAGVLLASVIRVRRAGMPRPLVILDAAMNDLARPALYGAWHAILPLSATRLTAAPEPTDVAGPVCESTDILARARLLAPLQPNDSVAILDCGAYGAVMSSTYNARPLAAQVMVEPTLGTPGFTLIRPCTDATSLWAGEAMPHRPATQPDAAPAESRLPQPPQPDSMRQDGTGADQTHRDPARADRHGTAAGQMLGPAHPAETDRDGAGTNQTPGRSHLTGTDRDGTGAGQMLGRAHQAGTDQDGSGAGQTLNPARSAETDQDGTGAGHTSSGAFQG